ncbi:MAG: DegT/DnrJ/EryC1/StrS family aminotransferase [Acutalibacteraceae bacterium]
MRNIPFSPPDITEKEIEAVAEVMRSGWITTGPKTKEFERRLTDYCGSAGTACLNSDTAALECTMRVLGIGEGDEVITSAYTYTASAAAALHVGATVRLCDTARDSFFMDYDKLRDMITPKTKAIIAVDIGGTMCDYDRIFEIVQEKSALFTPKNALQSGFGRCIVIADGAHSLGATYHNMPSGSVADFTCFSFHAVKNLTTAEGGAAMWRAQPFIDNAEIYKKYMLCSLHGQSKDALAKTKAGAWEYDIVEPLYKCNMTDIMAAIGVAQLDRYEQMLQKRKKLCEIYDDILADRIFIKPRFKTAEYESSRHLYLLRIEGITPNQRNLLIEKAAENGVATNVHYKPLPMMTAYKNLGFEIADYPNAYAQFANEISLPLNTKMSEDDARYAAETIAELCKNI